jgi:hypothetical protein
MRWLSMSPILRFSSSLQRSPVAQKVAMIVQCFRFVVWSQCADFEIRQRPGQRPGEKARHHRTAQHWPSIIREGDCKRGNVVTH